MLEKLKKQYEKLGKEIIEIENNQPEKWVKIFAPMWSDEKGNTTRYAISYIRFDELYKVSDFKILEEYNNKSEMLSILK
jgi:hypothetical protein